ncbi:uncharacterized protein LOC142330507 [Lycorma delicatula]|uniref:uncharacterized protein LOC142330507 n=1 Tax=Lycorma delicatula TaxID=130591 RepID=UPI003F5182C4
MAIQPLITDMKIRSTICEHKIEQLDENFSKDYTDNNKKESSSHSEENGENKQSKTLLWQSNDFFFKDETRSSNRNPELEKIYDFEYALKHDPSITLPLSVYLHDDMTYNLSYHGKLTSKEQIIFDTFPEKIKNKYKKKRNTVNLQKLRKKRKSYEKRIKIQHQKLLQRITFEIEHYINNTVNWKELKESKFSAYDDEIGKEKLLNNTFSTRKNQRNDINNSSICLNLTKEKIHSFKNSHSNASRNVVEDLTNLKQKYNNHVNLNESKKAFIKNDKSYFNKRFENRYLKVTCRYNGAKAKTIKKNGRCSKNLHVVTTAKKMIVISKKINVRSRRTYRRNSSNRNTTLRSRKYSRNKLQRTQSKRRIRRRATRKQFEYN